MPEGDTIFRAADTLTRAIGGKIVRRARSSLSALAGAESLAGHRIERVEASGKHLIIAFDDGRVIHSHMRMTGSWHIYRPGEAWLKPERMARIVLETDDFVAVCFNAPVVELLRAGAGASGAPHPSVRHLGPDLLKDNFDGIEARRRLQALAPAPIGDAIMRQTAVAGIGNVYKSEVLFLCRVDPFLSVGALSDEALDRVIEKGRELMGQNLGGGPRTTRRALHGPRVWVYGRSGEPCLVCGTIIRMRRQGLAGRSTYWCPGCQPASSEGPRAPRTTGA